MNDFKNKIEDLRTKSNEFDHLNNKIFLDHAANAIYMKSLINDYYLKLSENLFCNSHSNSESGIYTHNLINLTRDKILNLFNTNSNEYDLVFVSNATNAIKLLAETFQFTSKSSEHKPVEENKRSIFAYLNDNHTSVIGFREFVWSKYPNCSVYCCYENNENNSVFKAELVDCGVESKLENVEIARNLFIYPAQSNFNGCKYPLDWISKIKANNDKSFDNLIKTSNDWFVCLDAASFVCTSVLDLSKFKPDFMVVSFYKIFGFPTGLGALLIHKSEQVKNSLQKSYFGGGTISMALINERKFVFRDSDYHEFMEDGTISYLDIIGVNLAINRFHQLFTNKFFSMIQLYTEHLTEFCYQKLCDLIHYNGEELVEIYRQNNHTYGPIMAFNLKDSKKNYISYVLVNKLSQEFGIHLRVGCFCNIGACKMHLKSLNLLENFQLFGHKCGDHIDLINGCPTGAIRISFGYCTIEDDILKLVQFLSINFLEVEEKFENNIQANEESLNHVDVLTKQYFKIVNLFIYPIKSCAPFEIKDSSGWPICNKTNSFMYDRHWILIDNNQIPLTQKRLPLLTKLHVDINLNENRIQLIYKSNSINLELELNKDEKINSRRVTICTHKIDGYDCGDEVAKWLKEQFELDYECRLIKLLVQNESDAVSCSNIKSDAPKTTFNNKGDYLLISINSIRKLRNYLLNSFNMNITDNKILFNIDKELMMQFRANFVIEILNNYNEGKLSEEYWKVININDNMRFKVVSLCTRCQMININQATLFNDSDLEHKNIFNQLLKELYKFKNNSKFGIYITRIEDDIQKFSDNGDKVQSEFDKNLSIGNIGVALFDVK